MSTLKGILMMVFAVFLTFGITNTMDISMNIESWKSKKGSREEAAKEKNE